MRQIPSALAPAGYSSNRLNPLSPAPVSDQGQRLTDLMAIQRLFAKGESGGYWPVDPAYLYEDSTGEFAASVNGVVGLQLDVSRALSAGQNLVAGLAQLTAYSARTSLSLVGDVLTVNCLSNGPYGVYFNFAIAPGTVYAINISYTNNTGKGIYFDSSGATLSIDALSVIGQNGLLVIPNNGFFMYVSGGIAGESFSISSVSIKNIKSHAAVQATTANKPYLRKTPVSNKFWLDSNTATGALTATFASSLGSACTIATVGAEGVTIADSRTVGTTYNLCPPYGYNGDVLIINRALTATEKALVKRVMGRNVPTLGSELVTNGSFENGTTGWSNRPSFPYNAFSVTDGIARVTGNASNDLGGAYQLLKSGNVYGQQFYLSCMFRAVTNNTSAYRIVNSIGQSRLPVKSNTTTNFLTLPFASFATETTYGYGVTLIPNSISGVAEFDNVTCREIL